MTQPPNSWDDGSTPDPSVPPPGGNPPPAGGYPPAGGGYPTPPPAGYPSSDDKTWALIAHFGGAAGMLVGWGSGGWIAPLIALLVQGNKSPVARAHAIAALNFQIPLSVLGVIAWPFYCVFGVGVLITLAAMIVGIVFGIIAGLRANEGQLYTYPMSSFALIK
jgi:uncharacterized Tic20 family protein